MIDTFAIMFSTIMCLFVVFRAMKMDQRVPWFESLQEKPQAPKEPEPDPLEPVHWAADWEQ